MVLMVIFSGQKGYKANDYSCIVDGLMGRGPVQ